MQHILEPSFAQSVPEEHQEDDDAEGLCFQLFRPRAGAASTTKEPNRISLADEPAEAFKPRARPSSYYFASSLTAEEHARFEGVAVTGADVAMWSRAQAPGLRCPWRVRKITVSRKALITLVEKDMKSVDASEAGEVRRTGRKGKKARIKLRKKLQAVRQREEADSESVLEEQKRMKEKEEYLAEKKRKLNRKKQGRKREKARLAKVESGTGNDVGGTRGEDNRATSS